MTRETPVLPFFILACLIICCAPSMAPALEPDQVVVVTNGNVPEGGELAGHYMKARNVPRGNLIEITTTRDEQISREDFDKSVASPIRNWLLRNDPDGRKFRCLVLMYGIPLRVAPPALSGEEKKRLAALQERKTKLAAEIVRAGQRVDKALRDEEAALGEQIRKLSRADSGASVDSELALVLEKDHPLEGWLANRYFLGFRGKKIEGMPQKVLMVSRLDGPTPAVVRRMIDDSIEAERRGLAGKAYFDARWPVKEKKEPSAYETYDRAIHNAARIVEKSGKMPAVLDEREALFQPGEAPNAALYCGWYSLGKYVDAFTWARGAVGYHIASAECTTLKRPNSTVWCKMMLEKGVAATLGPVAEPYLQAFPPPDLFSACIIDGRFPLAECYNVSNPFWSWQMVLIGDPLYRPFLKSSSQSHE
ncbi:MAG TPA: TIGR03790 family protein [Geobacteraceae bacterium]